MPAVLEWPGGVKKPFVTDIPTVTSDYFPTALEVAGIPLPKDREYDGISLLPLIEGRMKKRKAGIGFHSRGMQAWTETRYKIIRPVPKKKNNTQWELYDLLTDPFEEENLAKKHLEVVERMDRDFSMWVESAETDQQKVIAKYYRKK